MRGPTLLLALFVAGCAPCEFDSAIVRGEVLGQDGEPLPAGLVQLIPTSGETTELTLFGEGFYEGSVAAGDYEVVAYDEAQTCFSEIHEVTVEPCDELVVDLTIVGCF